MSARRGSSLAPLLRGEVGKRAADAVCYWGEAALTMSRWMPPQRVQRMVQYSAPARPGMMRSTARAALHCGQFDIACRDGSCVGLGSACGIGAAISRAVTA